MTKFTGLGLWTFLLLSFGLAFIKEADQTSQDETALVKKLSAVCGKDGIKVSVRFTQPFKGIVYSDGHYDTPDCIFIDQERNAKWSSVPETRFSFLIPADECGTKFHDPGSALSSQNDNTSLQPVNELANEVYMENTVMFQQSHLIQEQGDLAQTLRCVWQKEIRRPLHATLPLAIRGKHNKKSTEEKRQYLQLPSSSSSTSPLTISALSTTRDFTKEYLTSYLTSSQQRHSDIRKKFQPKGQVESVSYGNSRRSGKSLSFRAPPPIVTAKQLKSDNEVLLYRNPSNFTALPFKADDDSSSSSSSRARSTATSQFSFVSFHPKIICLAWLLSLQQSFYGI